MRNFFFLAVQLAHWCVSLPKFYLIETIFTGSISYKVYIFNMNHRCGGHRKQQRMNIYCNQQEAWISTISDQVLDVLIFSFLFSQKCYTNIIAVIISSLDATAAAGVSHKTRTQHRRTPLLFFFLYFISSMDHCEGLSASGFSLGNSGTHSLST